METPDIIYLSPYKQGEGQDYIGLAWTHPSKFCNHVAYVRRDLIEGMIRDKKERIEQKPVDEQFPPLEGLDAIKAKYYDEGFKNGFDEGVESVKPVEWSEEDERILTGIIERGSSQVPFGEPALRGEQMEWLMNRLKSLRNRVGKEFLQPHWKPSEEQMKAFKGYIEDFQERAEAAVGGWNNYDVMIRMYEQLKKL